jgi:hypothetical protein
MARFDLRVPIRTGAELEISAITRSGLNVKAAREVLGSILLSGVEALLERSDGRKAMKRHVTICTLLNYEYITEPLAPTSSAIPGSFETSSSRPLATIKCI